MTFEKFFKNNGGVLLIGLALAGCAHTQQDKDLDAKFAAERKVSSYADLGTETSKAIETAPGLKDGQRAQLLALRTSTRQKIDDNWQTTLKLRSVLIKEMLSPNYNEDSVEIIKGRMRDLEDARLGTIFDAIAQANKILGKDVAQNQRILHDLLDEGPRGTRH